jgi:hypothetical protein
MKLLRLLVLEKKEKSIKKGENELKVETFENK